MRRRRTARSAGFTLVEVMLTTVLAAVLLVALWSLLSMYSKAFEGGHARTEQSQLARALLEQVSTDLQSVLIAPPTMSPVAPAVAATASTVGATVAVGPGTPPSAPPIAPVRAVVAVSASLPSHAPPTFDGNTPGLPMPNDGGNSTLSYPSVATSSLRPAGLFGTSTFLQVDVLQPAMLPPRASDESSLVDPEAQPRADELRTVTYTFGEYRDPANPTAAGETRLVRRESSWAQAHPARGRETELAAAEPATATVLVSAASDELDRASSPTTVATSRDAAELDEHSSEIAETSVPEVLAFGLRYFDGTLWSEEWDSASRQGLPAAIEVSLRLRSPEEPIASTTAEPADKPGVDREKVEQRKHPTHRLLVPLALARKSTRANDKSRVPLPIETPSSLGARANGGFELP